MSNVWLKRNQKIIMPTNLTEDREVEFTLIKRSQIQKLREYWNWHRFHGSINQVEYESVLGVIEYLENA